jgi:hypothetical protein
MFLQHKFRCERHSTARSSQTTLSLFCKFQTSLVEHVMIEGFVCLLEYTGVYFVFVDKFSKDFFVGLETTNVPV